MIFDLICAGVVVLFALLGLMRGLIRQIFGLAGFIGGIILSRLFAAPLADEYHAQMGLSASVAAILFGFALFFAVALVARILGGLLHGLFEGGITGMLDRLGGLGVGFLKGLLFAWALASLVALAQPYLKPLEKKSTLVASLELDHSQALAAAKSQSSLGDQAKRLRADAEAQIRKAQRGAALHRP